MIQARPIFDRLTALADPTRSRLLLLLDRHELTVGELCVALQLPQSTVSRHLKTLADEGWVSARAEGTSRRYAMSGLALDPSARGLWQLVRDQVSATPSARQDLVRAERVLQERRTTSQAFFSSTAGQWDRVRAELYGSRTDLVPLAALLDPSSVVGDLGCGSGQTSAALAPFVSRVLAIDESSAMLAAARERVGHHANVELRSGRLEALPIDDAALDIAVLSLVLHFVVDPAAVIREAARALRPGGSSADRRHGAARTRGVPLDDGPPLARLLRRADDVVARIGWLRDTTHRPARPRSAGEGARIVHRARDSLALGLGRIHAFTHSRTHALTHSHSRTHDVSWPRQPDLPPPPRSIVRRSRWPTSPWPSSAARRSDSPSRRCPASWRCAPSTRAAAARGREDHGLAAHDRADGRADRDARRARRRRALGELQHLLDAGSRGGGRRRRARGHGGEPEGHARVRVEGRDARGVLVVHRAGADVARRHGPEPPAR